MPSGKAEMRQRILAQLLIQLNCYEFIVHFIVVVCAFRMPSC